jgi:hypothetical protein
MAMWILVIWYFVRDIAPVSSFRQAQRIALHWSMAKYEVFRILKLHLTNLHIIELLVSDGIPVQNHIIQHCLNDFMMAIRSVKNSVLTGISR